MKSKKFISIWAALILLVLLSSCNRKIGTGVILWSADENQINSGTVVNIYEESRIRHKYLIAQVGSKEKFELETWRVSFFNKEKDAKKFSEQYSPYFTSFAYSTKKGGLPIRDAMIVRPNNRVYKLREGLEIKILDKSEKTNVGNLTGHWYKVLTDDGVTGYVFDYYLTVYSMLDEERIIENAKDNSDPLLENFLQNTWRQTYFSDMITKNNIDLSLFKDSYSFTINPEKKEISLKTSNKTITEYYTEYARFGAKQYDFKGTSFKVKLISDSFASIQYKYDNTDYNEAYIIVEEDINEIISSELERRDTRLKEFIEKGAVFHSNSYGSITLDSSGIFIWNDIEELISQKIISPDSEPQGRVEFNHFLDSLIKNNYSGVITFNFRNGSTVSFLYSYTDKGVNFIFVPEKYIENKIISTDKFFDPVWISFEFSNNQKDN